MKAPNPRTLQNMEGYAKGHMVPVGGAVSYERGTPVCRISPACRISSWGGATTVRFQIGLLYINRKAPAGCYRGYYSNIRFGPPHEPTLGLWDPPSSGAGPCFQVSPVCSMPPWEVQGYLA